MERDTEEQLQDAIIYNILEKDNHSRISAISVREKPFGSRTLMEAWIVVEVPEEKGRFFGEEMMGMTE